MKHLLTILLALVLLALIVPAQTSFAEKKKKEVVTVNVTIFPSQAQAIKEIKTNWDVRCILWKHYATYNDKGKIKGWKWSVVSDDYIGKADKKGKIIAKLPLQKLRRNDVKLYYRIKVLGGWAYHDTSSFRYQIDTNYAATYDLILNMSRK